MNTLRDLNENYKPTVPGSILTPDGEWVCTDPDTLQFAQFTPLKEWRIRQMKTYNFIFEFYEGSPMDITIRDWKDHRLWEVQDIDVSSLSIQEREEALSPFYGEDKGDYLENDMIIAECVFENDNPVI